MPIESNKARGATRNSTPTRFNLKERLVEGDWLDSVESLDGIVPRRTTVTIEKPGLTEEPIVPVAEKSAAALWGPSSGHLVAALLCLSIAGAVSAMTWAGPRVYWAMAQDGVITPWLAHRHPETGVPTRAILFQTLWASALIISGTFEQLVIYSGLMLAFFMALTLSAIFPLRARSQDSLPAYRSPWYPILPALLVLGAMLVVGSSLMQRPFEALYGAVTVLGGLPFYFYWKPRNVRTAQRKAQ